MHRIHSKSARSVIFGVILLLAALLVIGCDGDDGDDGAAGPPGSSRGTISGVVTNSLTGAAVEGVEVTLDPAVAGVDMTTGAGGRYSATLPIGNYSLTYDKSNFDSSTLSVSVIAEETTTRDVALEPTGKVVLSTGGPYSAAPGGTINIDAMAEVLDGSAIQSISWKQSNSVNVTINGANTMTPAVRLPGPNAYREELIHVLEEPPIAEDQLPENIHLPEGEFVGGLQKRFEVVGVNPFALEEAALVTLTVTVKTTSGTYTEDVEIHTDLPWKVSSGIANVPINVPVLLNGKEQNGYNWNLVAPAGSQATLQGANTRNPTFTPDVTGKYEVSVTDQSISSGITLEIYAGLWAGAITGQGADGRPVAANCTTCHDDTIAPNMFPEWRETGHAEIFTNNLNTSTHYGESCFPCHTVGFDPEADNGGIDEAADYDNFLAAGLINSPSPNNWTRVLNNYRETARRANIQCENCHGPNNDSGVHPVFEGGSEERLSISSDVCGACHGEPLRHARFQQWQLSRHSNYELAVDEGESGNCSRCHTGNGFLTWLPVLLDNDPATDPTASISVGWESDETHPQTCATCHDPHKIGTVSGDNTNATVRISGDTPPLIAGFQAFGVGKGAICMTCHNTRRGLRNDSTFDTFSDPERAPHGGAQSDVLMGQNAYFIGDQVGLRGDHSFVEDSCVNCHMEQTPPPDLLAYNLGGTNHTFFPTADICSQCHGEGVTAAGVQNGIEASLAAIKGMLENKISTLIRSQTNAGNTIDLDGEATITSANTIRNIDFGEYHGRQAITVTYGDSRVRGPYRITDVEVIDGTGASLGNLFEVADETLPKAGWNYWLLHNDGSGGVHNPAFAKLVVKATEEALAAMP